MSEQATLADVSKAVFLFPHQSPSAYSHLITTAQQLVSPRGRGIYATDETPEAIGALLGAAEGANAGSRTQDDLRARRKQWRKDAYESLSSDHISGVILHNETLVDFGLASILKAKNIIPGVRANGEMVPFTHSPNEYWVEGLDGLLPQLVRAHAAGAMFSKFRVPIACTSLEKGLPTQASLDTQAETLAKFAAISQQAGLVPVIEPDIEFSEDADLARSVAVHQLAIRTIYSRCLEHGVLLEGSLLKPSFPQPGLKHQSRPHVTVVEIAQGTLSVIANAVPPAVQGVMFLSGGLAPNVATDFLAAVNILVNTSQANSPHARLPPLSFSFGRAIQGEALKHWAKGDIDAMRKALTQMSEACWKASKGER